MDLDDFEQLQSEDQATRAPPNFENSLPSLLRYFDELWYSAANRRGFVMDLMGDYGGSELFIIHGDSLLQNILADPLLAIANDTDLSFQITHAIYDLERILFEFRRRSANFHIVFWEDTRHSTLHTGSPLFAFTSRHLARSILYQHLKSLQIDVFAFKNTTDPLWLDYRRVNRPMYILLNDGGAGDTNSTTDCYTDIRLQQRSLVFEMISQGVSVSLLAAVEFRDSKIISLVIEQRADPNARQYLGTKFWEHVKISLQRLNSISSDQSPYLPLALYTQPIKPAEANVLESVIHETVSSIVDQGLQLEGGTAELLYIFMAHILLLPGIPIENRAQPSLQFDAKLTNQLRTSFLPIVFTTLNETQAKHSPIPIDGRIFLSLLSFFLEHPSLSSSQAIGSVVSERLAAIWKAHKLPVVNLSHLATIWQPAVLEPAPASDTQTFGVLPFQNEVFDELLSDVRVDVDSESQEHDNNVHLEFSKGFNESQHWHNHRRPILPKHLGGEKAPPKDQWFRSRELRRDQRFMAQLERQAQTITGTFGKGLQRIVITVSSQPLDKQGSEVQTKITRRAPKKESASERIKRENAEKKQAKADESNEEWWMNTLQAMSRMPITQRMEYLRTLLQNPKRTSGHGWLAVEMRLYELHLDLLSWLEHPNRDSVHDHYSVTLMRKVKDISENGGLFYYAAKAVASILIALGCKDLLNTMVDSSPHSILEDRRKLHFEFLKLVTSRSQTPIYTFMRIKEDLCEWQLRLFGPFMDRSMDSKPDSRVHFNPDAWQRQVLDCLDDDGHSLLVVAPTSAGKTFISYYAMEKVLRSGDSDVLVYVAPTKALVSQIAAEVYARFSKSYKSSRSCWAIHTRDYRIHDPIDCQILITVPEILASFLLSPALARTWVPRVKRIILDEIHSIGQQEGGAVWEQIILLAPCPIVGLSATVGNPQQFNDWLESVQTSHGYKHTFINHPHRYSHLRKFTYITIPRSESLKNLANGLGSYTPSINLRYLHPVSMLSFGARDIPPDFSLESADCLTLYQALKQLKYSDEDEVDVIQYESELKKILSRIIGASDAHDHASPLQSIARHLQDPVIARLGSTEQNQIPSKSAFFDNLLPFVADLHSQDNLPALLFSFDRTACEKMAENLLSRLVELESQWKKGPEWRSKLGKWETWKAGERERKRQAEKLTKQGRKGKFEDIVEQQPTWEESFNPSDPLPEFSFAARTGPYTQKDLEEDLGRMAWINLPLWAKQCLRRGIAVHHAGMNKHYRSLVESLFRMGFIRIVIATGTLALGINAPAKTSVFCGDSPYLTALQYRQCAGRAGRRGYDLLGKVVFYGLAMDRAQRLVLSKLPALGGNFPLTSTMVLRLFNLLQGSDNAPTAVNAIQRLMTLPQISFMFDTGRHQLLHHVRFSIDYLRRAGLLDSNGKTIDLCGIVAHLYYAEPSNLALVALFRQGVIHKICNQSNRANAKRDFILIMAHLFDRKNLPRVYTSANNVKERIKKSASMVLLPPLPKNARAVLQKHNEDMLKVFVTYAKAFVTRYRQDLGPDTTLPFSHYSYPTHNSPESSTNPFLSKLHEQTLRLGVRSAFVANSGHSDDFRSISELCRTARSGLHLNDHAIPTMEPFLDSDDDFSFALNAYILDFYIHGQPSSLVNANGIRPNDLWYLLQDFSLALKATRSSLEELLLGVSKDTQDDDEDVSDISEAATAINPADINKGRDTNDIAEDWDRHKLVEDWDKHSETVVGSSSCPVGVSPHDWNMFQVIDEVTNEFEEKFRAMWA